MKGLTDAQRIALSRVARVTGWARATNAGERVTLASLERRGYLERRAWRGVAGEPDAAYEYRLAPALRAALDRSTGSSPRGCRRARDRAEVAPADARPVLVAGEGLRARGEPDGGRVMIERRRPWSIAGLEPARSSFFSLLSLPVSSTGAPSIGTGETGETGQGGAQASPEPAFLEPDLDDVMPCGCCAGSCYCDGGEEA